MLRRGGLALLALTLVTAGCVGTVPEDDQPPQAEGDIAKLEASELPSQAPAEGERGLAEAPTLRQGEWWTVELASDTFEVEAEATIVVAGVEGGAYMIGMPSDDYVVEALILHLPGIGPVGTNSFAYEAHDAIFEPVSFPLEAGQTWTTEWYTGDLDAEVVDADAGAGSATVELVGDSEHVTVTYEAGLGIPASVEMDGYGSYEVVDHGYGFEGDVKVPWQHDIVFLNGRIAGALDTTLEPAPPIEEITVEEDYDEAAIALLMGNLVAEGPPGVYRVQAEDPNGEAYEDTFLPQPGGTQVHMQTHTASDPTGTWQMEYEAGGAGIAAVEGMAYEVVERTLG